MKPLTFVGASILVASALLLRKRNPNRKILENAFTLLGLQEQQGKLSNPVIDHMFKTFGFSYFKDDIAWCSLFVNYILKISGYQYTGSLMAKSFLEYPSPNLRLDELIAGDIVVISRGDPSSIYGHVAFYIKQDENKIYLLGGNQSDEVNVYHFNKNRFIVGKRPIK